MNRRFLFLGPSLEAAYVHRHLPDCVVLPPAAAGDFARLDAGPGDTVGLVDGYFRDRGSVRHKEILAVMARGVRVLGASSMGALRAAELHPFGMEGVGRIFGWFRDGHIDGDDEVALVHLDERSGYAGLTLALVNLRDQLARALASGIVTAETAGRVVAAAKELAYHERELPRILQVVRADGANELAALESFLAEDGGDLKREDAMELVERMKRPAGPAPRPDRRDVATMYQLRLEHAVCGSAGAPADGAAYDLCRMLHPGFPAFHREVALTLLSAYAAQGRALHAPPQDTLASLFEQAAGRRCEEWLADALRAVALEELGLVAAGGDRCALIAGHLACAGIADTSLPAIPPLWVAPGEASWLVDGWIAAAARAMHDESHLPLFVAMLKLRPAFEDALVHAAALAEFADTLAEARPDVLLDRRATPELLGWAHERWRSGLPLDIELLDRGFRTAEEFAKVAYRVRLYADLVPSFEPDLQPPAWLATFRGSVRSLART